MSKVKSNTKLASLAMFAGLALLPMGTRADDGGGDGGAYDFPAANAQIARTEERVAERVTCVEAKKVAWFAHELERSDGDVEPAIDMPRECNREIYATADEVTE